VVLRVPCLSVLLGCGIQPKTLNPKPQTPNPKPRPSRPGHPFQRVASALSQCLVCAWLTRYMARRSTVFNAKYSAVPTSITAAAMYSPAL